jgi:peptidoglycan/xylan/chitin deacetylase (PgdA/CDA1 family)
VRSIALDVLAASGRITGRTAASLARPRVHFVYLHHVLEDEEAAFRTLVRHLASRARLVPYAQAVERVRRGPIDEPCVAFSFDDGFASCARAAAILEEHGARACFFVVPTMIGETSPERIVAFCRDRLGTGPVEFLDWRGVDRLLAAGHEIGSHTLSHARIAGLAPDRMREEIAGSRELLLGRTGRAEHFSWPFGTFGDFAAEAVAIVRDAGYASCASAVRGCHVEPARDGWPCLRRENVLAQWPPAHVDWFLARSARRATVRDNRWPVAWDAGTEASTCASRS